MSLQTLVLCGDDSEFQIWASEHPEEDALPVRFPLDLIRMEAFKIVFTGSWEVRDRRLIEMAHQLKVEGGLELSVESTPEAEEPVILRREKRSE